MRSPTERKWQFVHASRSPFVEYGNRPVPAIVAGTYRNLSVCPESTSNAQLPRRVTCATADHTHLVTIRSTSSSTVACNNLHCGGRLAVRACGLQSGQASSGG